MKLLKEQQSGKSGDSAEAAVSSELLQGEIVDLKSKLNALKNENVKLKEGLAKSKQANQQYKTLADSAEKQVCSVIAFDFFLVMQSKVLCTCTLLSDLFCYRLAAYVHSA